jgi:hypothetical protein
MPKEVIFLGHDNWISRILRENGTAQDLAAVSTITMTFGDVLVSSSNQGSDEIRWNQTGYDTGEIRINLGNRMDLPAGDHRVPIVVYDATYPDGLVWDIVDVVVVPEVEA